MANFGTHIGIATAGGVLLAHGGWQAELWAWGEAPWIIGLTALGGIAPDMDADNSHAISLIFNLMAVVAIVVAAVQLNGWLVPRDLMLACAGLYVGVRFLLAGIFKRFTVHRGNWHSLFTAAFAGLATATASHALLQSPPELAWLHGASLSIGWVIHLALDEIYSVDLVGSRLKRSFGTAMKLFDTRTPGETAMLALSGVAMMPYVPSLMALSHLLEQGTRLWR